MRSLAAVVLLLLAVTAAFAQGTSTRVQGTFTGISGPEPGIPRTNDGGTISLTFDCVGAPTCVGTYQGSYRNSGCTNSFTIAEPLTITGLNLSSPGPLQVTFTLTRFETHDQFNPDGTCSLRAIPAQDTTLTFTGTWSGTSGTLGLNFTDAGTGTQISLAVTFTAQSPAFPLTVTSNINATTASAAAQIQYRAQDVGTTGSVFAFLLAPRSLVGGLLAAKADGDCVLAQVNTSGQLIAVTASTMQPAITGVLGAQGASVTLLNNISTPAVAGSTAFVGYGTDAATMLSSGVNQSAVSVPGAAQCASSLTRSPGALSGLFWNPGESGWGIDFTQRGNNIFAAWYTYDASGNPKWYVSTCVLASGATPSSTTCNGTLFQVTGPRYFGQAFNPSAVSATSAGTLQVAFSSADRASMTYTLGTQTRTVAIERSPVATGSTQPLIDHTDIWWDPNESGWGVALAQQFQVIFAAWYVYSDSGQPVWYVVPNCAVNSAGNRCNGAVYRTTGPPFGPTFSPAAVTAFEVGTATFAFTDANNATLAYTVNGINGSKNITRNLF